MAIIIGLRLDYFWSLNPKQFQKYINVYEKQEEIRLKEKDMLNHILGKYIAYAYNDPKKYPEEPFTLSVNKSTMNDDDMERVAMKITSKMGGVVNGS